MSRRVTRNSAKGKSAMPRKLLYEGDGSSASDADDVDSSFDDSMALLARSILALTKKTRKTQARKKRTPKRRPRGQPRGQWLMPGFPCMLSCNCSAHSDNAGPSQSSATTSKGTTKKERKTRGKNTRQPTTSMDIDLLSDEEDVSLKDSQVNSLQSKVNNFFKVIESSDEEMEMLSKTINPAPAQVKEKNFYVIPSDSDNEDATPSASLTNHEESVIFVPDNSLCGPSKPNSTKPTASTSKSSSSLKEDLFVVVDDIIDNYGGGSSQSPKHAPVKSLEELKKKTEEILGSVSSLIEDMNKKANKPEEKVVDPNTKPSCPICLDELGPQCKPWVTFCGHMFCEQCIKAVCKSGKKCPTCRKKVSLKEVHPVYL